MNLNSLFSGFQILFSHSQVFTCHTSQGRSPAISLPCVTFSSWVVFSQTSPVSSYPNTSTYHLKYHFQKTSRSPRERMSLPSEFTWFLHTTLSCIHRTVPASQALTQGKQIFSTCFQMNERI